MARRRLQDKRALVTGASGGIGRAIALELARAASIRCWSPVAATSSRQSSQKFQPLGRRAEAVVGDVTDPAVRRPARWKSPAKSSADSTFS